MAARGKHWGGWHGVNRGQSAGLPALELPEVPAPPAKYPRDTPFRLQARKFYHLFTILSADCARGFWARSARAVRADICVAGGGCGSACDERHLFQLTAGGGPANFGGGTSALMRGKP